MAHPIPAAVVQHLPVLLRRAETFDRGVQLVAEAAREGAQLISFPETWVPGYPEWLWRLSPGALEDRCWVLGNGTAMRGREVPEDFPERDRVFPDQDTWFNHGDSVIVGPDGRVVAGPLRDEYGIIYADCDPAAAAAARRTLDVAGHHGRPDVFRLEVKTETQPPIVIS